MPPFIVTLDDSLLAAGISQLRNINIKRSILKS